VGRSCPTTTTLTVTVGTTDVTSVVAGTVVMLTATVVSGATPVNPGQVKFCVATAAHCEDSALLATTQLTTAGVAAFKFRPGIGSHSYQAVFVGTKSYAKSSSTTSALTVTGKYQTTTTITSSGSVGDYTLTATVVGVGSRSVSPTGAISFLDTTNGNASIGKAALGTATLGQTFAMVGFSGAGYSFRPLRIAVGDFNGDGIPDFASADYVNNTVSVGLGNGDGTFTLSSMTGVGNSPLSLVAGDFNSDGVLDLATSNVGDNTVTILLGNGDGTFTAKATLSVGDIGDNPSPIAVGDFNGDGVPDLAVSTGTVLLGNGDGTFTATSKPFVGSGAIAVDDFNGDGILDLALQNGTVLLGNGDGTFTVKATLPVVGNDPLVTGDFNGDGIPDLATANFNSNTVTLLLGIGDGTFTAGPTLNLPPEPNFLAVGDFNGDGVLDLAVVGPGDLTILLSQITETATASLSSAAVSGGELHQIRASYPGDANYQTGMSGTVDLLAKKIATTLQLTPSANPSIAGNLVVLTATLNPYSLASFTTDGETVTFYNGVTALGTGTLSSGIAYQYLSSPPAGTDTLTASYSGDANFSVASGTVVQTVSQVATTLNLSSSTNPSIAGSQITLTATLNPYATSNPYDEPILTTDGETVTFYSGGKSIGIGALSSGVATLNINPLLGGSYTLRATYPGDTNFTASNSPSNTWFTPTLQLSSSTNTSIFGNQVTLTATLSPYSLTGSSTNGETVTFYNGGTSIGTGTLSSGVATVKVTSLPPGTDELRATYAGDSDFFGTTSSTLVQTVTTATLPAYVVTVNTDTTSGVPSNCTGAGSANCSLRDALAAASSTGTRVITFDPKVFASPQTITLGSGGGLTIPSNTTIYIAGPTAGSGAALKNLVTVSGGGPVFTVNSENAAISGLTITGGNANNGGGILNSGVLTVSDSTISGNLANGGVDGGAYGGGIANLGTLTLINCSVVGNSAPAGGPNGAGLGGGIYNQGTLTIINSSVVGNNASGTAYGSPSDVSVFGGGIYGGVTTGTNNIISGNNTSYTNTNNGSEDDCDSGSCGTNGVAGNVIGVAGLLAPFGNYGGPTPTMPPLPGSPAICAGIVADISPGVTTDQRGFPRTTTYGVNPPCVDSGAVQTNYSLAFSTQPPEVVAPNTSFKVGVHLSESGKPFPVSGISIPLALGAGSTGSLSGGSAATGNTGSAVYSSLQVSAQGFPDTLVATLPLTASGITPAVSATATSTAFDVIQNGSPTATPAFSPSPASDASPVLTITDATPHATFYYSTDGSTPTTSSNVYTKPIVFYHSGTFTVKAIAVASGFAPSAVATFSYTIEPQVATPALSLTSGTYAPNTSLTITDATPGAVIHYSTDGSTPTASSDVYTKPIVFYHQGTFTVKAIAVASGYRNSTAATGVYTIGP